MKISKKNVKNKKINEVNGLKGPMDRFIEQAKMNDDSLTLSDFECDSVNLDLSDIVNGIIS